MSSSNQSEIKYYGVFSKVQFGSLKQNKKLPYVYYVDMDDNLFQITEVRSVSFKSPFLDASPAIPLKDFFKAYKEPLLDGATVHNTPK